MEPTPDNLLRETYRLTKENNELLHRMRRSSFLWGIIKFVFYMVLLFAPIWYYMTYLNGTVENLLQTLNKIEGVNAQAQNQFLGLERALQQFSPSTSTNTTTH